MADKIPDESLGLVYIDADHSYNGVKSDIQCWWPKLCNGGILAAHDYANQDYGVKRAMVEHMKGEDKINILNENGGIENIGCWVQKINDEI